jgi:DNA polymerase III subunit gamma/tau
MSYQVLARKWRPQTFADVVGQEHVLTALANGLSLGRIHHAYLFSGTRGVGKTSIARLLAKGLNCETGITATPCGVCDNCREIEQGRFVDLIEIDAASRTKVEDTRDLLDNVQYAPARGRFKVYLIDEVHMLSRHSFNALLKTLEEPPEHVKFLLATTDPQKLPVTILSRCLQFHLKALDVEQIRHQLEHILNEEHIAHEPRALQLLARAAEGSLRDALSLTDQAIASGDGQVSTQAVSAMLGTLDDDQALSLVEAMVEANGERVMALINEAAARGIEWEALLVEMLGLLHRIAMVQLSPAALGNDMAAIELRMRELALEKAPAKKEAYRWKATTPVMQQKEVVATPKALKKALEHEKTPELAAKLAAEAIERDAWAAQVSQLSLPKLVEQVALNAWKEESDNAVCLHLRTSQRHLNNRGAQQKLAEALSTLKGSTVELTIVEDDNPAVRTPLEWRQAIYEEKLAQARESIIADNNIQTLRRFFDAELDEDSIRPI